MSDHDKRSFPYDIALSFAGEDRQWAEALAKTLNERGIKVFYDSFERAGLWGKDLYEYLADVYSNRAQYCIMILSENYAKKAWTNHERRSAQTRAFRENREYILPIRLDDTTIPGISETIGYLDLRHNTVDRIADIAEEKLGRSNCDPRPLTARGQKTTTSGSDTSIPLPRIKKSFSQREKDKYLRETFEFIKEYFKQALSQLEAHRQGVETDFIEVNNLKFMCKVYVEGSVKNQCKIWIGGSFSSDAVLYHEGRIDLGRDGTYNDYITVEENGFEMYLRLSNMWFGAHRPEQTAVDKEEAAAYLWKRFSSSLEY